MVDLSCETVRREGITLVELVVENRTPLPRRLRIANRLDGPAWPPRREGVPEAGWDDGGFEGVVEAGGRLALGYASPATPADPPAEVVWTERTTARERPPDHDDVPAVEPTAAGVVRTLGDPSPPAAAVPRPGGGQSRAPRDDETTDEPELPPGVATWFAAVTERVERAERVAEATTVTEVARELERAGGVDAVDESAARLEADRTALEAVERRARRLAERADDARETVPVDAYRRLA